MTARVIAALVACGASVGVPPSSLGGQRTLEPSELLQSVERSLPQLERARRDLQVASGELEEAQGGFDLSIKSSAKSIRGYYDNDRVSTLLEQPLTPFGLTTFGGYRAGRGLFAPYDTRAQTLSDGELVAGFSVPLLRDRAIDGRRAAREVTRLGTEVAQRTLTKARLSYYKEALSAYWDWVAAGQQRRIAQALLELAEARDRQLADGVALGQVAPVERTDNRRAILQRRAALVSAERQLQMTSIGLSLYYRSAAGEPDRPAADRLPPLPPSSTVPVIDENHAVNLAIAGRPELQALRLKRDQQQVDVRFAENRVLPSLDWVTQGARDFGGGPASRVGSVFESELSFTFPIQNRKASGKRLQARAKLSGIAQELRWMEDQVRAEVQDALSAEQAATAALAVIGEELAVARELEALERERFALGDSTQFLVNLRELATADAALRETKALIDYRKALVTLDAATGQLLSAATP